MPTILCAGLIAVDLVFDLPTYPDEGSKARAGAARMIAGGGALNAAIAIARLGGHAMLAGAIGDDPFGHYLRNMLQREGIDGQLLTTRPGLPTSYSAILVTGNGERTIINHRDARLFDDLPRVPFPRCDAVLTDTRLPGVALGLLRAAREAGCPAIVDAEAPLDDAEALLQAASHIAFSEQGLADFSMDAPRAALSAARARFGAWVAVTRGPEPALYCDATGLHEAAPPRVTARDTLGAGDAWHGAFALALARGEAEAAAVAFANTVAATMVSGRAADRYPTAAEVAALAAVR